MSSWRDALIDFDPIPPVRGSGRVVLCGCGDSLAAAQIGQIGGHTVVSAGDIAWSGFELLPSDTLVALSGSGGTAATVQAARIARDRGAAIWACTANETSTLAEMADSHTLLPSTAGEDVPAIGYALMAIYVASIVGKQEDLGRRVVDAVDRLEAPVRSLAHSIAPASVAVTVATTADLHRVGHFWTLKLIEAAGVPARTVPVEEMGHIDYFIGPQKHSSVFLKGADSAERTESLAEAVGRNGHATGILDVGELDVEQGDLAREIALSYCGGVFGAETAVVLGREPFRGGAVDMSASHLRE